MANQFATFNRYAQNDLDYLYKKLAQLVTKTDDVTIRSVPVGNEPYNTSSVVYADSVWAQSSYLTNGAVAAVTGTPQVAEPGSVTAARIQQNPTIVADDWPSWSDTSSKNFVLMTSVYGFSTLPGISSYPDLRGLSWIANTKHQNDANPLNNNQGPNYVQNWISPSIHPDFQPVFTVVPSGDDPYSEGTNSATFSLLSTNYIFDYKTGILTFPSGPPTASGLTGPSVLSSYDLSRPDLYDLYITGYTYVGQDLTTYSGGTGGGGIGPTGVIDPNLVHNLGTFAYVYGATGSYTYNNISNYLNYTFTIYGNATRYKVNYTYTPALSIIGATGTTTSVISTIYNGYTITPSFQLSNPSAGGYTGAINITTIPAGGTGTGSSYTMYMPITITQSDTMSNAIIINWPSPLTIVQGTPIVVSGITYFGPGSYTTIPLRALTVGNIYNIVGPGTFYYISFGGGSSGSYLANSSNLVYGAQSYTNFPSASGLNVNYYNKTAITLTITGTSAITALLNNAVNKSSSYTFFPSTYTGQTTETLIGYLGAAPSEEVIFLNQGGTSNPAISSMVRMSNTASSSKTTPSDGNIASFNSSSLSSNDPAYYPYDGYFYANDFAPSVNEMYVLPSVASFSAGTKYLLIKVNATAPIANLTLRLGSTATGISGVWVKWYDTVHSTSYGWHSASRDWQLSGGCQNGYSGNQYTWQIKLNSADYNTYNNNTTTGYIYFNIEFTESIPLNQILVQ
jgi:hypothetical protein